MKTRIEPLDSLRGIFALLVVMYHAYIAHSFVDLNMVRYGDLAVDYFFLLSGFVIALAYGDKITSAATFRTFLIRRIARLWPLHLVMFALFMAFFLLRVAVADGTDGPSLDATFLRGAVREFFLISAWYNTNFASLNLPSWSISVELWVYVLFGLVLLFRLPVYTSSLALIVLAGLWQSGVISLGFGSSYDFGLAHGIYFFFTGYFCHEIYRWMQARDLQFGSLAELSVIALILLTFSFYQQTPWSSLLLAPVFAVAILVLSRGRGIVSSGLSTAPLLMLGRLSFSIYMTHYLVLQVSSTAVRMLEQRSGQSLRSPHVIEGKDVMIVDFGVPLWNNLYLVGLIGVVLIFSYLTWRFVEMPGQRLGKYLTRQDTPARPRPA